MCSPIWSTWPSRPGAPCRATCGPKPGATAIGASCCAPASWESSPSRSWPTACAAPSHYSGMPKVALSEIAVHQDDMLRPLGLSPRLDPATVVAALDVLRRVDRWMPKLAFHGPSHRHVRLVATDTDWSSGRGPEVQGRALDLLALLGNRRGAGEGLSGPGVERLPVPGAATP